MAGQQLLEVVERIYATGLGETGREWRVQRVLDDTGIPREAFVDIALSPRFGPDGAVVGVNAAVVDVTAEVLARRAAQAQATAVERRYARARDLIDTLQRELLPPGLPVLPGTRIAASYLPADDGVAGTAAGGDWFDAVPLPDGGVALVVGDVVGHGVAASAVMGQLRAVLADRLDGGAGVTGALAAADRMARRVPAARAATVCVAVLDPTDGSVSYCTAGHPPPLLVPAHGQARYLPPTGAGPLGSGPEFTVRAEKLDVGDMLVLYSDGIVERPGRALSASTVELALVAADTAAGRALDTGETSAVERVCTQTLELLVRATGHTDDITLVAAQRLDPVPDLHLDVVADVPAVPATRTALARWLREIGAPEEDGLMLQHAVGELVTNAVEHAYGDTGTVDATDTVTVDATLTRDGQVHVVVSDPGRWRGAPSAADRGRGLAMSRHMVDSLTLDRRPDGTTAALDLRLLRPARLLTADTFAGGTAPVPARTADPHVLLILDQPTEEGTRIGLHGPVDAATAPRLYAELTRRIQVGDLPLTVDLTGVTHLASAGVSVLHGFGDATAEGRLRLLAPTGSPAAHVLALVALPHAMSEPDAVG